MDELEAGVVQEEAQQEEAGPATEEQTQTQADLPQGETAGEQQQQQIPNHVWETARKRAQAEAERKLQAKIDQWYTQVYAGQVNPYTNTPIRTEAEFRAYMEQHQKAQRAQQLQAVGIDEGIIQSLVNENPVVQQAKEIIGRTKEERGQAALQGELKRISELDPAVKSISDLAKMPTFQKFDALVHRGYGLADAFRIANFDVLAQKRAEAAQQAAIKKMQANQAASPGALGVDADVPAKSFADMTDNEFEKYIEMAKRGELKKE